VETICSGDGIEPKQALDLLSQLVEKSLVVAETQQQEQARYRLLETIRQYAREKLFESGETDALRRRHRDWFLALAERAEVEWRGPKQKEWFDRLESEHDNLRAALEWSKRDPEGAEAGLRLGAALWRFWEVRNYVREGRQQLAELLALPEATQPTAARAGTERCGLSGGFASGLCDSGYTPQREPDTRA
jgi:non-specific serine/threonine protein kinase